MMGEKKQTVETRFYAVASVLTVISVGLILTGLLLPYWYEVKTHVGIVNTTMHIGLWQDRICIGGMECDNSWKSSDTTVNFPEGDLIRGFETAATAVAILALVSLIPLWATVVMHSTYFYRMAAYVTFFATTMISAFLAVVGTLIIASKGNDDYIEWAPFFSGIGGAVLFISGCMACVICRYDPSYGSLENPVSPAFVRF